MSRSSSIVPGALDQKRVLNQSGHDVAPVRPAGRQAPQALQEFSGVIQPAGFAAHEHKMCSLPEPEVHHHHNGWHRSIRSGRLQAAGAGALRWINDITYTYIYI